MAPMNDPVVVCGALVGLLGYRISVRSMRIQKGIRKRFGRGALLFQYYAWIFVMMLVIIALSGNYIMLYDAAILSTDSGMEQSLRQTLSSVPRMQPEVAELWVDQLAVGPNLRVLSLVSLVAAVLTFVVAFSHVYWLVSEDATGIPWFPAYRQDLVLQVLMLPPIYATMSLRNVVRMWSIMLGTGWSGQVSEGGWEWSDFVRDNMGTYEDNFAVANLAEIYAVWCYSKLCLNLLKDSIKTADIRATLARVTMQGIHSFMLIGSVKVVCSIWLHRLQAHPELCAEQHTAHLVASWPWDPQKVNAVNDFMNALQILASVQCLYNMVMICAMPQLRDINPFSKFFGIGVIIVFAQMQSFFLDSVSICNRGGRFDLSVYQARLLHASLMCCECLAVSMLHSFAFPADDYEQGYMPLTRVKPGPWSFRPKAGT